MFEQSTPRLSLPCILPGQAQKEATHNEALYRLDGILHCVVEAIRPDPPAAAAAGQAWIVGNAPTGLWSGKANAVAFANDAGWRFIVPPEWMEVTLRPAGVRLRFVAGNWITPSRLSQPTGGTTVDAEARALLVEILQRLESFGMRG